MIVAGGPLVDMLSRYEARDPLESAHLARVRDLVAGETDPWSRALPLHLTASAVIVHPETSRVLLRWHPRHQSWLLVGGHGDPGETDPLDVIHREGEEETGLTDLRPWPSADLRQVAVVGVPAKGDEPAHEHADLRFVLATSAPDEAVPEEPGAPLRWFALGDARAEVAEDNVREFLDRLAT
ncbi:NUDIX hydrolase [Prauserella marina]|uniref:8-oxo-dGTP pyrophosphatase MutT, NUDIX family n=1 Tax=Prauserella marina TaxID=530584 RepID=A0A222VVU7_9PSEU|nr:NUDIX domain-containing protein [Prauserella marina]ASR38076.1 NUDIX hydrolase [Prauserella marina]PWV78772.1 8-oxo-dGTP pyrophosphatase MutT (NUDIX family) [Prauserella marina]SDC93248.1 8-oxo-dGTP pyrophosphatase MutT, NUDIX family [Prauserella marina]